jgi:hypothetical protein
MGDGAVLFVYSEKICRGRAAHGGLEHPLGHLQTQLR